MKYLLLPLGSHGDVHPFVGVGQRLKQRGGDVTLATNEPFRELVERAGLAFISIGADDEFQALVDNPDLWHPRKAFPLIAREAILPGMRRQFELIRGLHTPGETVLVGSALGYGGRLAHEALKLPFVSLHLQPSVLWSEYDSPLLARRLLLGDGVPRRLKRLQFAMGNWVVDRILLKETNAFRRELGLPPVRHALDMMHSPQRIVCMFPDWYAPPQPDWPPHVTMADFPRWDEHGVTEPDEEVEEFLAGESDRPPPVDARPIVFTPGTAMIHGAKFFQAAVDACVRLGRRGMLLTRHIEQIPRHLPPGVRHFHYAPLSQVLPRSAALVYHGGIGTLSQALAAGVPHVIMPMAHDQPDNARRIKKLGVGDQLWPERFTGPRLAALLDRLLHSPEVQQSCTSLAGRLDHADGMATACDAVIEAGRRPTRN